MGLVTTPACALLPRTNAMPLLAHLHVNAMVVTPAYLEVPVKGLRKENLRARVFQMTIVMTMAETAVTCFLVLPSVDAAMDRDVHQMVNALTGLVRYYFVNVYICIWIKIV